MKRLKALWIFAAVLVGVALPILFITTLGSASLVEDNPASVPFSPDGPVFFPPGGEQLYASEALSSQPETPRAGEPTRLCARLINTNASEVFTPTIELSVANFGIGLPFHPIQVSPVAVPPGGEGMHCVMWVPPFGGAFAFQARLSLSSYPDEIARRIFDVDEPLELNVPHKRPFPVHNNDEQETRTIELALISHQSNWPMSLSENILSDLQPGETRVVTLTVTPQGNFPVGEAPIADVVAHADGQFIGGFRKAYRPPVLLHRHPDPIFAESEITVQPYPPRSGEPTEVCVSMVNTTDVTQTAQVLFSWAPFGIGLPFTPINGWLPVSLPPYSTVNRCLMWVPPYGGQFCIQAELSMPGQAIQRSQRNMDVDEPLEPLTPHTRPIMVFNSSSQPVTITLGLIPLVPDWGFELSSDVLRNILPSGERVVMLTVTPPAELPPDETPVVDVEAYVGQELIGGFRKIYRPPVPVHRPRDPVYAESEIGVDPYPILPGQPVHLSVELHNPTDADMVITTTFSVAPFGIGLPFSEAGIAPNPVAVFVPSHGAATAHTVWEPPPSFHGKFCVMVSLQIPGHPPVWSQRNIDVGEPLEPGSPHQLKFPVSSGGATQPVTVTLGLVSHRPDWQMTLDPHQVVLNPEQNITATLLVTPGQGAELGTGAPIADVEAYVDGELIGGFRKLDIPPVPLHKPHEKGYAESEIQIEPYPPRIGQTSVVSATVQNSSDQPMTVDLEFGWANFGMGIPFSIEGMDPYTRSVHLAPGEVKTTAVDWTPVQSGHQCVRVLLNDSERRYEPQESQRNVEVIERITCGEHSYNFTITNSTSLTVTVEIGLISFNVPANWSVSTNPSGAIELSPYESVVVTVIVSIPCPETAQAKARLQALHQLQQGAGGLPTINVEGYAQGELIGGIQLQFMGEVEQSPLYLPLVIR